MIDAPERRFAAHGFHGVSMRMVAEAASVGLGTLTHYVASKEALLESVVLRRSAALSRAQSEAITSLDESGPQPRLRTFVESCLHLVESGDERWRSCTRLFAVFATDPDGSKCEFGELIRCGGDEYADGNEGTPARQGATSRPDAGTALPDAAHSFSCAAAPGNAGTTVRNYRWHTYGETNGWSEKNAGTLDSCFALAHQSISYEQNNISLIMPSASLTRKISA